MLLKNRYDGICFLKSKVFKKGIIADQQKIRAQEKNAVRAAIRKNEQARKEAKEKALLFRISQLKRVCICRLYCRG